MKIIDLSLTLKKEITPPQGHPQLEITSLKSHEKDCMAVNTITHSLHIGTHIDAPYHFIPGAITIDQVELTRLIGSAVLIDIQNYVLPQKAVTVADLYVGGWPQNARGKIAVIFSGWAEHHWDKKYYYTENPYLSEEAANFIAGSGIIALATDFPADAGHPFPVHRTILDAGILQIENLVNLHQLPHEFVLAAIPLKIHGGEAAPARVMAFIAEKAVTLPFQEKFVK